MTCRKSLVRIQYRLPKKMGIGPPVGHILTSDDVGLGTNEMKVKGTYVLSGTNKAITSRYLFLSEEEEKAFIKANPLYSKPPTFIDLEDGAPIRGVDIPYHVKKQKEIGILNEGEKIKPGHNKKLDQNPSNRPGVVPISKVMGKPKNGKLDKR